MDTLVPLETYPNLMLAELDKNRLLEAGVEAQVFDGNMGSFYSDAVGGIRLMVEAGKLETARSILQGETQDSGEPFDPAGEITADSKYCFRCHSKNLHAETVTETAGIFGRQIGRLIGRRGRRLKTRTVARCLDCGARQRSA